MFVDTIITGPMPGVNIMLRILGTTHPSPTTKRGLCLIDCQGTMLIRHPGDETTHFRTAAEVAPLKDLPEQGVEIFFQTGDPQSDARHFRATLAQLGLPTDTLYTASDIFKQHITANEHSEWGKWSHLMRTLRPFKDFAKPLQDADISFANAAQQVVNVEDYFKVSETFYKVGQRFPVKHMMPMGIPLPLPGGMLTAATFFIPAVDNEYRADFATLKNAILAVIGGEVDFSGLPVGILTSISIAGSEWHGLCTNEHYDSLFKGLEEYKSADPDYKIESLDQWVAAGKPDQVFLFQPLRT